MAPNYVISITGLWICLFTFCLPAHSAERLIIISIDGGRPDVLLRIDTPIIHRLVKTGSFTFWAQTIDLSITLPSHTSMLTGVGPEKHGITWNDYRSSKGTVAVTTVFEIVKNTGRSTAMIVGKEKFKHLNKKGTVDTFIYRDKLGAGAVVDEALKLFNKNGVPGLTFLHFYDMDGIGHKHGWGSPQQEESALAMDRAIGTLLGWIKKNPKVYANTDVIITADHGGHGRGHGEATAIDKTIPWIAWGNDIRAGHQVEASVNTMDTAATALWLLKLPVPNDWQGKPIKEIYRAKK